MTTQTRTASQQITDEVTSWPGVEAGHRKRGGGGVCGLATGMMLARDGHEVTLLERDPSPVPDSPEDAWESWDRAGVTQFHQPHYLQPRAREVLDDCLPDVTLALMGAGAVAVNPLKWMPPTISDQATRPGDERLTTVT